MGMPQSSRLWLGWPSPNPQRTQIFVAPFTSPAATKTTPQKQRVPVSRLCTHARRRYETLQTKKAASATGLELFDYIICRSPPARGSTPSLCARLSKDAI
ncbi:hypothetical protein K439DRAFT_713296 [Ramaria rubella]|nr:hypothetical protein K439DRAFT_713296 [Ramaria rubella]